MIRQRTETRYHPLTSKYLSNANPLARSKRQPHQIAVGPFRFLGASFCRAIQKRHTMRSAQWQTSTYLSSEGAVCGHGSGLSISFPNSGRSKPIRAYTRSHRTDNGDRPCYGTAAMSAYATAGYRFGNLVIAARKVRRLSPFKRSIQSARVMRLSVSRLRNG